jgi:hypothetical protein
VVWHLKPGGQVFFDVRSSSLLYDPIRRLRWKLGMGTRDANQLYSKRQLRSLFTSVGLADLRVVMRDYPVLGELFSRKSWDWPLTCATGSPPTGSSTGWEPRASSSEGSPA